MRILAAALAAVLALSMTACGDKTPDVEPIDDTAAYTAETEEAIDVTDAAELPSQEDESHAAETTAAGADESAEAATDTAEETTEAESKTPETIEEIVEFYKAAATETDKSSPKTQSKMSMTALDGGDGAAGKLIDLFKPIAQKALENNSSESTGITGGYKNLTADDVASATAKDDGKYTTVHMTLKKQVDGMNGKSTEGHVGHAISVLPGLQSALDELKGLDLDTSEGGSVTLTYNDAYLDAKIDNATGKIVSGKWHFKVDILIQNCKAKITFISAPLNNATGTVEYTITM